MIPNYSILSYSIARMFFFKDPGYPGDSNSSNFRQTQQPKKWFQFQTRYLFRSAELDDLHHHILITMAFLINIKIKIFQFSLSIIFLVQYLMKFFTLLMIKWCSITRCHYSKVRVIKNATNFPSPEYSILDIGITTHLCLTAAFFRSQGWPLYIVLTVLSKQASLKFSF